MEGITSFSFDGLQCTALWCTVSMYCLMKCFLVFSSKKNHYIKFIYYIFYTSLRSSEITKVPALAISIPFFSYCSVCSASLYEAVTTVHLRY